MSTSTLVWEAGTELPALFVPPISRTTLALFAVASGDHNPVHIDIDFAQEAGHDDVFVHGMLPMAYLGRLLTTHVNVASIVSLSARFLSITPIRSELTCTAQVVSIDDAHADGRRAQLNMEAALADGTVVVRGEAIVSLANGSVNLSSS